MTRATLRQLAVGVEQRSCVSRKPRAKPGEALGNLSPQNAKHRRCVSTVDLVPKHIVRQRPPVTFEDYPKFFLEADPSMMLFLLLDVRCFIPVSGPVPIRSNSHFYVTPQIVALIQNSSRQ
jgi:hypothetical protein